MNRHESGKSARAVRAINGDGRIIGLDIGATAVRATVLTPVASGGLPSVALHALGHVDLPLGAVVDGVVQNEPAVTGAIKHLARENGFASSNVILGTSNQQVVVREVRMPYLPPDQLRLALPFQARDVVALPINEAVLDFIPLGEVDN